MKQLFPRSPISQSCTRSLFSSQRSNDLNWEKTTRKKKKSWGCSPRPARVNWYFDCGRIDRHHGTRRFQPGEEVCPVFFSLFLFFSLSLLLPVAYFSNIISWGKNNDVASFRRSFVRSFVGKARMLRNCDRHTRWRNKYFLRSDIMPRLHGKYEKRKMSLLSIFQNNEFMEI